MGKEIFYYDNKIVKKFLYATIFWGVVGMLVGLIVALLLLFPNMLSGEISWLSFGRLRPLHTNAIIFAFVGNAMFTGIYYSLQRLLKTRMFSDFLSKINFWGWQFIIVLAAITLPLGFTSSKEYAELEWPIDILITLVWVVFTINLIGTILRRRERHLYVAIWFYIATAITVAVLHIFNSLEYPVSFFKSYSIYSGVQDALVQWWYGHNAVAFFLTTPFLGLMYYFIPKASNRPVYSYKLSIIHFWSLIFIYIWAGPHHLLYSSLPSWAQSLGVVFSVMLIAPSWGGMLNGLLTLRGAWDKVRDSVVLKFFVVAVTAYGMATFEGPMLSLKNVNAIAHFTDWIVGHVHIGGLGWNGFMVFGMTYYLVPKLWKKEIFSKKLANFHFWIATLGILFYAIPLYFAGFTQALMWKDFAVEGGQQLVHGNFLETVTRILPMYALRAFGGTLYIIGTLVMGYNIYKTISGAKVLDEKTEAMPLERVSKKRVSTEKLHSWLERKSVLFSILVLVAISVGGIIQIVPMMTVKSNVSDIETVMPYTALELEGRDIYIREGCNNCHSQMIRPFRSEVIRYGEYSRSGEYVYDHPHLWGSKRTGPDLHREGGKQSDSWHYKHMFDAEWMSPKSIMPRYPWLFQSKLDNKDLKVKLRVMQSLNVPYSDDYVEQAYEHYNLQSEQIANNLLKDKDIEKMENNFKKEKGDKYIPLKETEIVALIAYLQKLGIGLKK